VVKTTVVNIARGGVCDVSIMRPSMFGNPSVIGGRCPECGKVHRERGETIECFRAYLLRRVRHDADFREAVEALRGKRLGCCCVPLACHGHVYVEYLDGTGRDDDAVLNDMVNRLTGGS
jgi:hypothetical protein